MELSQPHPAAESSTRLPEGVAIVPRRPEGMRFDEVPRHWFAWSRGLSTALNLFSMIIPEHERFFIRTVRKYKSQVADAEEQQLLRAFMQQEAIHYQTHEAFNATRAAHGMDVERDSETIKKAFGALENHYPLKVRLGMTAFMEHVTAISAHQALGPHSTLQYMHPTMRELWEWHAIEEIEHKAVAYDLFKEAGGSYWLRIYSAVLVLLADARLFRILIRRAKRHAARERAEGIGAEPELTPDQRKQQRRAFRLERRAMWRLILAGARYFLPGFHPWQIDDSAALERAARNYQPVLQSGA